MPVVSNNSEVQELLGRIEKVFNSTERKNAETSWDEHSAYLLPSQSGVFNTDIQTKGGKKTSNIYDNTGIQANSDLASTFHSTLTNPATRWSNIEFDDPVLQEDDEARTWLEDSRNRMHKALNQSNFDVEVASNYQLFTSLGTMSLQHEALPLKPDGSFGGFFFKAWHLSNIAFEENMWGRVDTIYRKFKFTKRQAQERWGKDIPRKIQESNDPNAEFAFIHVIRPRVGADPNPTSLLVPVDKMPFESLYIYKEGEEIEGEIRNITEFGLFIGLDGDIDGMAHLSDLSWDKSGEEALTDYNKGDMVKAKILDVDVEKERISLGIKQLTDDPVGGALEGIKKGAVVTCTITDVQDSGIEVMVNDAIPGYIRKADLSRDRSEQRPDRFAAGEKVDAKITQVDKNGRRVTLSIKAREVDDEKKAMAEYGSTDSGATLGDILGAALAGNQDAQPAEEEKPKKAAAKKKADADDGDDAKSED